MNRRYKVAFSVAIVHLVIMLITVIPVAQNERAWMWMIWLIIDFPISYLTLLGWDAMAVTWGDVSWYGKNKITVHEMWPFFVHGVIGTTWWFLLTLFVCKVYSMARKGLVRKEN